ncbi:dTDP-4-dehydrorhamnose reductase, partial [Achromobacter xylosoxidans]
MKILLLGKNGQVGRELCRALLPLGEVVALGRGDADLRDQDALLTILTLHRPDVIVNAAACTAVDQAESDPDTAHQVNALAVATLARHARAAGALLVHYSTDYVFDGTQERPYTETDAPNPLNVYGRSKLEGEHAILASGCDALIFRTSWVYSTHGGNFLATVLRLARERESLDVVADQHGAPTSDAAGEARVVFDQRADDGDGRGVNVVHHLHGVRVGDGHGRQGHAARQAGGHVELQLPQGILAFGAGGEPGGVERQGGRVEAGAAHVDRDLLVVTLVQHQDAGGDLCAQRVAVGQALFVHEAHEAAGAVAAV